MLHIQRRKKFCYFLTPTYQVSCKSLLIIISRWKIKKIKYYTANYIQLLARHRNRLRISTFSTKPTLCVYVDLSCTKRAANLFSTSASTARARKVVREGERGTMLGPVYSHPGRWMFPSPFVALTTRGFPRRGGGATWTTDVRGNLLQSPSAFLVYTASRLSHHRPPFVHQWRARVHVHARTHTRDHASPPRTRGGIARITKRSPARRRASERPEIASSRSPQDRVAKSLSSRFAENWSTSTRRVDGSGRTKVSRKTSFWRECSFTLKRML